MGGVIWYFPILAKKYPEGSLIRFAKHCNVKVVRVQLRCLPLLVGSIKCRRLHGSMVKRTSSLASNEKFQVRFLVELLNRLEG